MQTPSEQRQSNIARMLAYTRRCAAWLKHSPDGFAERLADLDRRYCKGTALKRLWRSQWHSPSSNVLPFPPRSTP